MSAVAETDLFGVSQITAKKLRGVPRPIVRAEALENSKGGLQAPRRYLIFDN